MLTDAGLKISPADSVARYQGMMLSDIVTSAEHELGGPPPLDFLQQFEAERAVAFTDGLRPVPGAADAIRAVTTAGIAVCVASQGKLSKTELTLSLTGLRPLFRTGALFSAYSVFARQAVPRSLPARRRGDGRRPGRVRRDRGQPIRNQSRRQRRDTRPRAPR
jgi:beta-phosphoglucomutase-like phosphatase (HAD superfamily)